MKKPWSLYVLVLLHLILGVSALIGGGMMLWAPDGSLLGLEPERLRHTPFADYLLPGIILIVSNGFLPLLSATGLLWKPAWKPVDTLNLYPYMHWAWAYSLYTGIVVIIWITVQLFLTSYFWLHPVVIFLGISILIFTLLPVHIRYLMSPVGGNVYLCKTGEQIHGTKRGSVAGSVQVRHRGHHRIGTERKHRDGQSHGGATVWLWFRRTEGAGD